jgi:hypothetical protein
MPDNELTHVAQLRRNHTITLKHVGCKLKLLIDGRIVASNCHRSYDLIAFSVHAQASRVCHFIGTKQTRTFVLSEPLSFKRSAAPSNFRSEVCLIKIVGIAEVNSCAKESRQGNRRETTVFKRSVLEQALSPFIRLYVAISRRVTIHC